MNRLMALFFVLCSLASGCTADEPVDTAEVDPPRPRMPAAQTQALPDSLTASPSQALLQIPRPAPDVVLPTMDGDTLRLDAGGMVLVNFWATWCGPCIAEMPDLEALHRELKDDGFTLIGVSLDEEGETVVRPFIEAMNVTYPIVIDDGTLVDAFGGVPGLPTTFLINQEAEIINRFIGLFPAEEMRLPLRDMLGLSLE